MLVATDALNARAVGSGPDVLLLTHGFGSDQSIWARYLPWLSQHYRVITYDLPFAGNVDPAFFNLDRHGGIDGHAQDLLDILRSFAVTRCSLVGHSLGGLIGIFASIARPDLFERLILLGTSARYLDGPGYKGGFNAAMLETMFETVAANFRDWAMSYAPSATRKPLEDPESQTFLHSLLRIQPDITLAMARAIFLGDYRAHVKLCKTPCVILQTEEDEAVPLEAAQYLHACLKGSVLEIINAKGHLPHLSAPEEIADAFRRHLPRLSGPLRGRSQR
jgi:pimeloyl-ACP methyl ester carboxylesterase